MPTRLEAANWPPDLDDYYGREEIDYKKDEPWRFTFEDRYPNPVITKKVKLAIKGLWLWEMDDGELFIVNSSTKKKYDLNPSHGAINEALRSVSWKPRSAGDALMLATLRDVHSRSHTVFLERPSPKLGLPAAALKLIKVPVVTRPDELYRVVFYRLWTGRTCKKGSNRNLARCKSQVSDGSRDMSILEEECELVWKQENRCPPPRKLRVIPPPPRQLSITQKRKLWRQARDQLGKWTFGDSYFSDYFWGAAGEAADEFLPVLGISKYGSVSNDHVGRVNIQKLVGKIARMRVVLRAVKRKDEVTVRYLNPAIADWMVANLLPGRGQSLLHTPFAAAIYDRKLRPVVRAMAAALIFQIREGTASWFDTERYLTDPKSPDGRECEKLIAEVKAGKWDIYAGIRDKVDSDKFIKDPRFAYHSWMRRRIDKTQPAFARAMVVLLKRFDPEYFKKHSKLLNTIK